MWNFYPYRTFWFDNCPICCQMDREKRLMGVVDLLMRDDVRANVITDYVTVFFRLILIKLREHGHDYEDLRQLSRALGEEDVAKDYRCLWPSRVTIVTLAPEVALCVFFFHFSIPPFLSSIFLLLSFIFGLWICALCMCSPCCFKYVLSACYVLSICCLHAICFCVLSAYCMLSVYYLYTACCLYTVCMLCALYVLSVCSFCAVCVL